MNRKNSLSLVCAGALVFASALALANDPTSFAGKPLPALTFKTLGGKTWTTSSLKGKAFIVDCWATWCAPCIAASPTMQAFSKKYGKKGLVIIGANFNEPKSAVEKYVKKHGYTYEFSYGDDTIGTRLGISAIPVFLFVDRKGIVRKVDMGFDPGNSPKAWDKAVQALLK
jgi:cytochrome c biogenesis protein CcmG, thiol:disulfide interchange protein DsbE